MVFIFYSYFFKGFIYDTINNDLGSTSRFINSFGNLSVIMFIVLVIFEVVLAPVPGIILNVVGGGIFGPFLGSILVLVGNTIGASICYFLARYVGAGYFEKIINKKNLVKFENYKNKYGSVVLFTLRLNPLTSSDVFSYIAGLIKMKYGYFIISTILGLIPTVFILSYFGNYFINNGSNLFRLIFFIVGLLYFSLFLYGLYRLIRK